MNEVVQATGPSWEQLATRLRPFVRRRVASDPDTDDVMQEVLLRMHRGLPGLSNGDRFGPWMYRVARSAIADHLRTRLRHPIAQADREDGCDPFGEEDDAVARELAQYLSFFVALLPSPYREAITLTELEGRSQSEAARMLGIAPSTMKSRVQRGRRRLRRMLEACCEIAVDARGKVIACEPREQVRVRAGCCGSDHPNDQPLAVSSS